MSNEHEQQEDVLVPVEQETITFYGRPIVAARLADGRIAVFLLWLCEGLGLNAQAQVRRIRRTKSIADDLVTVRGDTGGGIIRAMPALILRSLSFWLAGIDVSRVTPDIESVVLAYQRECVDVLYQHFSQRKLPNLLAQVPAEAIPEPVAPGPSATRAEWREWRQAMRIWLDWQDEIDLWRERTETQLQDYETHLRDHDEQLGEIHSRLEGNEEISRMLAEFVVRQRPQTLTPEHQATVKHMVARLHELSGLGYSAIYADLNASFHVGKYSDIAETEWERVAAWLKTRIEATERRQRH